MIQTNFEDRAFFEAKIVVRKESGDRAYARTSTSADASSLTSTFDRACRRPNAGAHGDGLHFVFLAHPFALQFAFLTGLFHGVVSGNASDCGDQWHGSVASIDFIEAEKNAGVQALLDRADVSLDGFAARNHRAIAGNEVFRELGFEMLARLQIASVELVVEADQEARPLRDRIRGSLWSDGGILRK